MCLPAVCAFCINYDWRKAWYGFKKEKYKIGMEIGSELFNTIKNSNCEIVTTECGTCQVQIQHGTNQKAYHPVSVIRHMVENNSL